MGTPTKHHVMACQGAVGLTTVSVGAINGGACAHQQHNPSMQQCSWQGLNRMHIGLTSIPSSAAMHFANITLLT
jgi:hypothetical protein